MGILLTVTSAILLGFSNFFLKKSFKDFPPSVSFFIFSICSLFLWVPMGIVLGVDYKQWILGCIVGIVSAILGQAIYVYVLEKGELGITSTILSSFSLYTIIFSMIFNHERPSPVTLILMIVTVLGTITVSLPAKLNRAEFRKVKYILWAILAAICIGASDTFGKYFTNRSTTGSFIFYVALAQVLISFLYLKFDKQPLSQFQDILKKLREYRYALLGSFLLAVATMCFFLSFTLTLASIASPIASSGPAVSIVLGLIFLKEKISFKNWVGLSLILISIIAMGVTNP